MKIPKCSVCDEKDPKNFYPCRTRSNGFGSKCITHDREASRCRARKNFAYRQEHLLKKKYGISKVEFNEIFEAQGGLCGICFRHQSALTRTLSVDHNHKTGQVRGLLCDACNVAVGMLAIDTTRERLDGAIEYYERTKGDLNG